MRRANSAGMVGPILVAIGIAMAVLGFFGGSMGVPGLSVVQSYWGPENATILMNNMGSVSDVYPTWTIYHFWYGYSDTEPGVYHTVEGSVIKIYIDGSLHTTLTTTKNGAIWSLPTTLSPGTHVIELRYDGSGAYPPVTKSFTVNIPSPQAPPIISPEPEQLPDQKVGDFLKWGGVALSLLGLGVMAFRRP